MDEEEEILAEEPAGRRVANQLMFSQSIAFGMAVIERYGWLLLIGAVIIYCLWKKWVTPQLQAMQTMKQTAEMKKFDERVGAVHADRVQAARERAQQKYAADLQRRQEREEEKRRDTLAEREHQLQALQRGGSVKTEQKPSTSGHQSPITRLETDDADAFVRNAINTKPVVIFSKSTCPYCRKAKQALSVYRLSSSVYEIVELDEMRVSSNWIDMVQSTLAALTGSRTVPRVFIGGKCIGGGDDTANLHRSGQLEAMLREAGAMQ